MSAGGFAVYQGYLPVYKMLVPRFRPLDRAANRQKLLATWLRSKGFRRSALDPQALTAKVLSDCRTGGDFLRIVMDEIAAQQKVARWAVYDPDNVLYMPQIKSEIPDALFVHIIRDGRDIALSLQKMGGFRPFPWDRQQQGLLPTAIYWEWMVRKGRKHGASIPSDYHEIRYEDLVNQPQTALRDLGEFLGQGLDYRHIQEAGVGRLSESNSSFRLEEKGAEVNPVARWKKRLSADEIRSLEDMEGELLQELGYTLSTAADPEKLSPRAIALKMFYSKFLDAKLWMRVHTPLGRFSNMSPLELTPEVTASADSVQLTNGR